LKKLKSMSREGRINLNNKPLLKACFEKASAKLMARVSKDRFVLTDELSKTVEARATELTLDGVDAALSKLPPTDPIIAEVQAQMLRKLEDITDEIKSTVQEIVTEPPYGKKRGKQVKGARTKTSTTKGAARCSTPTPSQAVPGDNDSSPVIDLKKKKAPKRPYPAKIDEFWYQKERGKKVKVFWPEDHKWYPGKIGEYLPEKKRCVINYDDGEREELDLNSEKWQWVSSASYPTATRVSKKPDPPKKRGRKPAAKSDRPKKRVKLTKNGKGAKRSKNVTSSASSSLPTPPIIHTNFKSSKPKTKRSRGASSHLQLHSAKTNSLPTGKTAQLEAARRQERITSAAVREASLRTSPPDRAIACVPPPEGSRPFTALIQEHGAEAAVEARVVALLDGKWRDAVVAKFVEMDESAKQEFSVQMDLDNDDGRLWRVSSAQIRVLEKMQMHKNLRVGAPCEARDQNEWFSGTISDIHRGTEGAVVKVLFDIDDESEPVFQWFRNIDVRPNPKT